MTYKRILTGVLVLVIVVCAWLVLSVVAGIQFFLDVVTRALQSIVDFLGNHAEDFK